jgi:hypothetical protein
MLRPYAIDWFYLDSKCARSGTMSKSKDSFLDGLMKGVGKQLGKRRRDVNKAIDRFHEEANKDEMKAPEPVSAVDAEQISTEINAENAESAQETRETARSNERTGDEATG